MALQKRARHSPLTLTSLSLLLVCSVFAVLGVMQFSPSGYTLSIFTNTTGSAEFNSTTTSDTNSTPTEPPNIASIEPANRATIEPFSSCANTKVQAYYQMFEAFYRANITVFPRNGFLLGIVRHGGFLPHENVDPDIGILDTPIAQSTTNITGFNGVSYKLVRDMKVPGYALGWKGVDPWTKKPVPYAYYIHASTGKKYILGCFHKKKGGGWYYPRITGKHNHEGSLREGARFISEGASIVQEDGFHRTHFNESVFSSSRKAWLYDVAVRIPVGAEDFLTAQYGRNWRMWYKRESYEARPPKEPIELKLGDVPPKSLCD